LWQAVPHRGPHKRWSGIRATAGFRLISGWVHEDVSCAVRSSMRVCGNNSADLANQRSRGSWNHLAVCVDFFHLSPCVEQNKVGKFEVAIRGLPIRQLLLSCSSFLRRGPAKKKPALAGAAAAPDSLPFVASGCLEMLGGKGLGAKGLPAALSFLQTARKLCFGRTERFGEAIAFCFGGAPRRLRAGPVEKIKKNGTDPSQAQGYLLPADGGACRR